MTHDRSVVYFNHGRDCLARLVVSAVSLRRYWLGPIEILDTGESDGMIERIADDPRIGAAVKRIPLVRLPRNSCYCTKTTLWRHASYTKAVALDADTLVVGSLDDFMASLDTPSGLVVTKFANWTTANRIITKRIRQWLKVPGAEDLVRKTLAKPHLPVNCGIFGWDRAIAIDLLEEWERLSIEGHMCFVADEIALQLLLRKYHHLMLSDVWNASPLYTGQAPADVRIWHFHGGKHLRRHQGRALWEPAYRAVVKQNVAGIANWTQCAERDWLLHNEHEQRLKSEEVAAQHREASAG